MSESPLQHLLSTFRAASVTEREKGTYFEELTLAYFRHEATYANHYAQETKQNPRYPLDLLQQIIPVSLDTMKVVDGFPGLRI